MVDHSLAHYLRVELAVALMAIVASRWGLWQRFAARLEKALARLAARPRLCFFSLMGAAILLRMALLVVEPVPIPLFHDEFSYLLGADTFAHGRLTNPLPLVPAAFETIHTNMWPSYQSMYIPGTSLLLTLGKLLGLPWLSVLLITAGFVGALYWMAAGWLPRSYALAASLAGLAVCGSMNWWFDNYFCIALPALGSALVLGSLPRIHARQRPASTAVLGAGLAILVLTRPYEGLCLSLPCVLVLLYRLRPLGVRKLAALAALPVGILVLTFAWLMFYNWRGTGHPLLFAYAVNYRQYHITGPFLFSKSQPIPRYHLDMLRKFYLGAELPQYAFIKTHPVLAFVKKVTVYYYTFAVGFGILFFVGLGSVVRRSQERLLLAVVAAFGGFLVELVLMAWAPFPQYAAAASPLIFLLVGFGLYAMRQWQHPTWSGVRLTRGLLLAELLITANVLGLRITHHANLHEPQYVSKDRANVAREVLSRPGKQLCLVRYTRDHDGWQEWVFNGADPQSERLVWARSLDPETDRRLIEAYPGRQVWLVKPDFAGDLLGSYTAVGSYPAPGEIPAPQDQPALTPSEAHKVTH